jgi:MATE family multidrug resistance protein
MQNRRHSVKKILKFTFPLILTSLSANLLFIVDRLILARYSVDSMNTAALAGNFVSAVSYVGISIAQIAMVFVGQYNGAKEYKKTGCAPWQMIYLGALSFLMFVPISAFCHRFGLFPNHYAEEGIQYLRIIMAFAGLQVISSALSAFFIGRGQSLIVIGAVLFMNILNFLLNICLVFGVKGILAPLGIRGSAMATVISEAANILFLLIVFLNRSNRKSCGTFDYKFRKELFIDCIKTGFPLSVSKMFSIFGWFIILSLFNYASKDLATIESFTINVWVIFIFFADGGGKAIASLSATLIGENNLPEIKKLLRLFLNLNLIMCVFFSIPLVFYPNMIFQFLDMANGNVSHLYSDFKFVFASTWIIILLDGMYYLICGVLNSGGDTKFPMYLELATLWIGVVIPTAVLYFTGNLTTVRITYTLVPVTGIVNCAVIYHRYKELKWFHRLV